MGRISLIQIRHSPCDDWLSKDPVLAVAELGYETDTGRLKIGDGSTSWSLLNYLNFDSEQLPLGNDIDINSKGEFSIMQNSIQEWWTYPLATYLEASDRTLFGAIATDGKVLACEVDSNNTQTRVEVDQSTVDDHNCPALWAEEGRRLLFGYTRHNEDNILRFRVSEADGSIASLATAQTQTFSAADNTTYIQIHKNPLLSSSSIDAFYVFTRVTPNTWGVLDLTVDQATGIVTFGSMKILISTTEQTYISTSPNNDTNEPKIRIAWGFNPAVSQNAVRYLELDMTTGNIYSPMDSAIVGNLDGTNLPIETSDVTPVLGELIDGYSRRLFYVRAGKENPAIAYAEWNNNTPDAAEYKIMWGNNIGSSWTVRNYSESGQRVGYTPGANYIAGMAFPDPTYDGSFVLARVKNNISAVELHNTTPSSDSAIVSVTSSNNRLIRPSMARNSLGKTLYSIVSSYGDYTSYESAIGLSLDKAVAVEVYSSSSQWQNWNMNVRGTGGMVISNVNVAYARYKIVDSNMLEYSASATFDISGALSASVMIDLPMQPKLAIESKVGGAYVTNSDGSKSGYVLLCPNNEPNAAYVRRYATTTWDSGSGRAFRIFGSFEIG